MAPVLIVGGGLTGLVAAERLEQTGVPAVVLEREAEPGANDVRQWSSAAG